MDFWNARYDRTDYVFGEAPSVFLASHADLVRGHRKALAIADGEGRNGVWLAEQGLDVLSMDASEIGLAKAARLAARRGVDLRTLLLDIDDYDWPEAGFDLVVASFIQFSPPASRDRVFAGIVATLQPGGLLLLQGYRPEQQGYGTGGPAELEKFYTENLLRDRFAALDILSLVSHDSELHEGAAHRGMSALIDLVARKPG